MAMGGSGVNFVGREEMDAERRMGFVGAVGGFLGRGRIGAGGRVCTSGGAAVASMTLMQGERTTRGGRKDGRQEKKAWRRKKPVNDTKQDEEWRKKKHIERRNEVKGLQGDEDSKLVVMLDYLRGLGLSIEDCGKVIQRRPQLLDLDIQSNVEPTLKLLHSRSFNMSEKQVARTVRNAPQIFFKNRNLFWPRVEFLQSVGIEGGALAAAVSSRPHILWMEHKRAQTTVEWFKTKFSLESPSMVGKYLLAVPQVLIEGPERMEETVGWLQSRLGLDEASSIEICKKWPLIFSFKPEQSFGRRLDYLRKAGLSEATVVAVIEDTPNVLGMSVPARLEKHIENLTELGLSGPVLEDVVAGVPHFFTTSVDSRIEFLKSIGLSNELIAKVIAARPAVLHASVENSLRPKWEYLTSTMGGGASDLEALPNFFVYNLEERIMPRYAFCCARGISASVKEMLGGSDQNFCRRIAKLSYEEYRQFESQGQWMLFSTPVL